MMNWKLFDSDLCCLLDTWLEKISHNVWVDTLKNLSFDRPLGRIVERDGCAMREPGKVIA